MKNRLVAQHTETGLYWADGEHTDKPWEATQWVPGACVPGIPTLIFTWAANGGEWLDPVSKELVYRAVPVPATTASAARNLELAAMASETLAIALTASAAGAKRGEVEDALDALRSARASLRYIGQRAEQARAQIEGPRE